MRQRYYIPARMSALDSLPTLDRPQHSRLRSSLPLTGMTALCCHSAQMNFNKLHSRKLPFVRPAAFCAEWTAATRTFRSFAVGAQSRVMLTQHALRKADFVEKLLLDRLAIS